MTKPRIPVILNIDFKLANAAVSVCCCSILSALSSFMEKRSISNPNKNHNTSTISLKITQWTSLLSFRFHTPCSSVIKILPQKIKNTTATIILAHLEIDKSDARDA